MKCDTCQRTTAKKHLLAGRCTLCVAREMSGLEPDTPEHYEKRTGKKFSDSPSQSGKEGFVEGSQPSM